MRNFSFLIFSISLMLSFTSGAELVDRIVAVVNSEIVLKSDFQNLKTKLSGSSMIDESLLDNTDIDSLAKDRNAQLNYLINEKLLDSEVKRLNLSVTMDRVQLEIKEMAKRNNISSEEVLAAVKAQGMDVAEYQDFLKNRIERQNLLEQEIISKIRVTEEDAFSEYLKKNPTSKNAVSEYKIAQILFRVKKDATPDSVLLKAQGVYNRLKRGEKFDDLAEQNSEDPNFSPGGLLGTFKSGEFSKEIEEAIKKIEVGDVTSVVHTRQGFHIFKLLDSKMIKDPHFEKQKPAITAQLVEKNFKRQLKIWLQSKRDESFLKINDTEKK
ncbi:MAG: peptidylprolyl isomerase [Bdellovibrionaceae bacterium]|nr:peptidylprolyl isomerase [Pseudobdellovibrionaceae bacterium]